MSNNVNNSGIGFCGILTIIFFVLKVLGILKWSWLWVFSPIWIPIVFGIIFIIAIAIVIYISDLLKDV